MKNLLCRILAGLALFAIALSPALVAQQRSVLETTITPAPSVVKLVRLILPAQAAANQVNEH